MKSSSYSLIALDLDGTLLNSRKKIDPKALSEIRKAASLGKTLVFDTGRAVPELADLIPFLPEVRYAIFASGAELYDLQTRKALELHPLPAACTEEILRLARTKAVMPQLVLPDRDVIQQSQMERLEEYHMGVYRPMYEKAMTLVPDIYAFAEACTDPVLKINLYHEDLHERVRTRAQLAHLPMETVFSEVTSLECSARGIDKGTGLRRLCDVLGLSPADCLAVGDAENDIPMIRAAGLGVAMGNSTDEVKAAADCIVADADHGGCAQAIRLSYAGMDDILE